jgi:hypothetical protein
MYGRRVIPLCINGQRYEWNFVIANITKAILGADFLRHHNLLVDLSGQRLLDTETYCSVPCTMSSSITTGWTHIADSNSTFLNLLDEFSTLTKPVFNQETPSHGVEHIIPMQTHLCVHVPIVFHQINLQLSRRNLMQWMLWASFVAPTVLGLMAIGVYVEIQTS